MTLCSDYTKALVERRVNANDIQPLGSIRVFGRNQIYLERSQNLIGHIREFAVQGLAADDDELLLARDPASGSQSVINLLFLH